MPRILVIDDEEPIRSVLRKALTCLGHTVIEAADGKEGLRKFADQGADLVITDLVMPETEGFEVLMTLKGEHPEVKIIAISGGGRQGASDNLKMAKYLGASRVIQKPMSLAQLTEALNELLPAAGTLQSVFLS
jgi:CheY-like chemotaxis protein